jgi:DNA-binding transcriptional MerR regulator
VAWSIAEVARMSQVTSRTLRHYDGIGLLAPAHIGANGYRYYGDEQLLRLQQILLLRELGLPLATIAGILDGQRDRLQALRRHEQRIRAERDRLARLATTISRTIAQMEGGDTMAPEDLFEGFEPRQAEQECDFVERYGEGVRRHFETSRQATKGWTRQDYLDARCRGRAMDTRLVELMRSGVAPDSAQAMEVMADHHRDVSLFWTPDRTSYTGLGQAYADDPQLRAHYEALSPGLPEYLRDAMATYAAQRLN